ncbi:hypothetical protein DFJ43DRAFT_1166217 [Lentinula guzmanii]|uniref:Glycosyltransferase family 1 protein n=1 Tax=Lentinula guzmanii TaxID=2804957 RepID=A0AA38JDH2_9AGAR|nr:hypothetical protein DFJ43DRAFT_1166217 [Lentinula guzmanii]
MAATISKHIVLHAHAIAWGHNKLLASLAVLIVESCPEVVVTFLTSTSMLPRIMSELERLNSSHSQVIRSRLHVLDISDAILDPRLPLAGFALAHAALQKGKAVTCRSSGKTIANLPAPTLGIIDVRPVLEELADTKDPFFSAHPSPWITLPRKRRSLWSGAYMRVEQYSGGVGLPNSLPCQADQPYNATLMIMSRNHQVGSELFSVRTGDNGVRLPYRYKDAPAPPCFTTEEAKEEIRALFKRIKDEEGVVVRKNFYMLAESMGKVWDAEGPAKVDFSAFWQRYV